MGGFLFRETIDGWRSWGKLFQDPEAFAPLIREIFRIHALPAGEIGRLTPGTNAVFRVGDAVVKILAPAESGLPPDRTELAGLRHAEAAGAAGPRILAFGELRDRYLFPYIVMELVEGREAGDVLPGLPPEERRAFAGQLRGLTARLNVPALSELPDNVVENVIENRRWSKFPKSLHKLAIAQARALSRESFVYVHGDLTDENVLIAQDGGIRLIDFGDSHLAPAYYDWGPVVFELFRCDPVMMEGYFGDFSSPAFVETLADSLLLHDFGADILWQRCLSSPDRATYITDKKALISVLEKTLRKGCR